MLLSLGALGGGMCRLLEKHEKVCGDVFSPHFLKGPVTCPATLAAFHTKTPARERGHGDQPTSVF